MTGLEQAQANTALPPGWRVTEALDCRPPGGTGIEWKAIAARKTLSDGTMLSVDVCRHSYPRLHEAPAAQWKRPGDLVCVEGDAWHPGARCRDFHIVMDDGSLYAVAVMVDALVETHRAAAKKSAAPTTASTTPVATPAR